MNEINKNIKVEMIFIFGIIYTILSLIISDIHSFSDIIYFRDNYQIKYLFYFSGLIVNPILCIVNFIYGFTLIAYGKKTKQFLIIIIGIFTLVSLLAQICLSIIDFGYGEYIELIENDGKSMAGFILLIYRGLATLGIGLFSGILSGIVFLIHFFKKKNFYGKMGIIIFLFCIMIGIVFKAFANGNSIYILIFILMMYIKGIGFIIALKQV
jgi:hypothetical protein